MTFTVTGYRRGELAKPLLERPVDNEEEWWAETFRDVVAGGVLRRIYDRIPRRLRLASPEAWRDALIAWRSEIGPDEPLLFWGRDWPLSWSRDRGVGEAIATRLNTRDSSAEILARTPFLDGVRLVSLPTCGEPTLLAPASMFRRLIVSAPHGRPIAITTAEDPTDPTKVKLTLHARFTLDLDRPDRALILDAVTDPA
ncbi:MAG: hypothetical protein RML45_14900 [Acetobacteraceae bacterium]|nr:hypothetical protein [Acetobacteraceae bacterium]